MKIAELLRIIADEIDIEHAAAEQQSVATVEIVAQTPEEDTDDLAQLAKLAGVAKATTEPDVQVYPVSAAFPAGNDIHYSKNPADMRTDSISLYPGYGARD